MLEAAKAELADIQLVLVLPVSFSPSLSPLLPAFFRSHISTSSFISIFASVYVLACASFAAYASVLTYASFASWLAGPHAAERGSADGHPRAGPRAAACHAHHGQLHPSRVCPRKGRDIFWLTCCYTLARARQHAHGEDVADD